MNENEQKEKPNHAPEVKKSPQQQIQRQRTSGSPETRTNPTGSTITSTGAIPGAGNSNSLPGHQSGRSKHGPEHYADHQNISSQMRDSNSANHSPPMSLLRKKNLSTSDLDPLERRKQAALTKAEAKLEKAQRLHQVAGQNLEKEIAEFLRINALPTTNPEGNFHRTANLASDKRIRTFQDTKKELEKKISTYQMDISRIHAGEIPANYSSSKDILSNLKQTAAKVTGAGQKQRSTPTHDSSANSHDLFTPIDHDQHFHFPHQNPASNSLNASSTASAATNNNQTLQNNTTELNYSSHSSLGSNEISNSHFYIDSTHEHIYDSEKSNRRHDTNIPADTLAVHDAERSPISKRRLTDDSNTEINDRTSDHSNDDRFTNINATKRNLSTSTNTVEHQQIFNRMDTMQKIIDRYETRTAEMQKQIDSLMSVCENQREQNERLNNELTDLTDIHQSDMSLVKTDLKNLEERLLYKFNDYWNELIDKLDKLDTRTAKVEQTQTHSLETEENTHRIISKLVNILLTLFAIILLLLSTVKNLVQSRIHAVTFLILVIVWISFHYLPPNYFQTSILKNLPTVFTKKS